MDNEKTKPDKDQAFIAKIQIIAGKTKADANPDELEHLKKLIKKNVPFSLRGYFMAYLLREGMSTKESIKRPVINSRPVVKNEQASSGAEKTEDRAVEKPLPAGAKTLYLNIGKMKRLYAKELSQVFQTELGLTRDDIYSIRIHDKYSFVSMSEENCEKAIAEINGMDIKGRTVTVNYSNKE
jgi:hypothetical protein